MSEDALKIAEIASEIWRLKYLKAKDELAKAVLEEREARARICEADELLWGIHYAKTIRARGGKDE